MDFKPISSDTFYYSSPTSPYFSGSCLYAMPITNNPK